jgi:hypothetical protein
LKKSAGKFASTKCELFKKGVMPKGEPNKSTPPKKTVKKNTKQAHADAVASVLKALSK